MAQGAIQRRVEQFGALYAKNALVAWRNRRATFLRLFAPFIFLLLALCIDKAIQANNANSSVLEDVKRPNSEAINPIPRCTEDRYIGNKDCLELTYSPVNAITQAIMSNVVSRNEKPIKAQGFGSRQEVQRFLLANPDYVLAAVHFVFDNDAAASPNLQGFVIQTNTTVKAFKNQFQDLNKFVRLPLQSAVHREITRYQLSKSPATSSLADTLSWYIGLKIFAHPTIATQSVLGLVLGPFVFAACMFSFVTQISAVVMEKEMGLRQAMRTMGMQDSAYWLSWAVWELTLAFISGHLICIFGLILQFKLFLKNNYGLLFFLFFLFQLAMSSIALMLSAFIKRTQTAIYVGFVIFIVGWIMQSVVISDASIYSPDFWTTSTVNAVVTAIFSALPWNLLAKGFNDLGQATASGEALGLRWTERKSYCQNIPVIDDQGKWGQANGYNPRTQYVDFECVMPLDQIYKVLIALWLGYLALAVYFDNVLKNELGVRRPILYFLYPSYWAPSAMSPSAALSHVLKEDHIGPGRELSAGDEDVLAEEARIRELLNHRTGHTTKEGELASYVDARYAVEMYGLKKKYGGSTGCCGRTVMCCGLCEACSCKNQPSFWPIKGSWLAIEQNQLFCLLGPNGAGKTTTINCLTGALPPTAGDALVYGQSIRSVGGMDKIRSIMGVCPQFDVLWNELTGREHLMLYGRIKGCGWKNVATEADVLLEKVKLTYAATQRSGAYSGGMKRRLSVAIALLGDPKVVYLDEPTTGMDPISRRYVWDIIQESKVGRAIILTTHSMEEADILGDRIGIMALGRLRCLGSSLRLKQRFGSGYQVAVSVQPGIGEHVDSTVLLKREADVQDVFKTQMNLTPYDKGRVYTTYLVPRERESELIPFLQRLESQTQQLGITDIQLSLTSLEEVFLTIAKRAALEAAQSSAGPLKKDLHFCSTCMKSILLCACFPFTLCFWSKAKTFLLGKDKEVKDVATLPDGTTIPVQPGQAFVQDDQGRTWQVVWGVDDNGMLVVQDTKAAPEGAAAAAGLSVAAAPGVCYSAVGGKARVPLGRNVVMEVAVGDSYVMNPQDNSTWHITWGKDPLGQDAIVGVAPAGMMAPQQTPMYAPPVNGSNGYLPVAAPAPGAGPPVAPYQNGQN